MISFEKLRKEMIERDLKERGISNQKILDVMMEIPRENFVPEELKNFAYEDHPLTIGFRQTISQPFTVALMCSLLELKGDEKVLDIGTGSGYEAAILSKLARKVVSMERIPKLAQRARENLRSIGIKNVEVIVGDGSCGAEKYAPYEAIKSAAAADYIPGDWLKQLKNEGRIVMPLKRNYSQDLIRITKRNDGFYKESFGEVMFVPLISEI